MSQEIINIGTLPNDGEGDPLRVAFGKINNNFTSLFSTATSTFQSNTTGVTSNQIIWQTPVTGFTQGQFQVLSGNPLNNDSQNITISASLTPDSSAVKWSGYATTFNGNAITTYNMSIASGNVRLTVTPLVNANLQHFIAATVTDK